MWNPFCWSSNSTLCLPCCGLTVFTTRCGVNSLCHFCRFTTPTKKQRLDVGFSGKHTFNHPIEDTTRRVKTEVSLYFRDNSCVANTKSQRQMSSHNRIFTVPMQFLAIFGGCARTLTSSDTSFLRTKHCNKFAQRLSKFVRSVQIKRSQQQKARELFWEINQRFCVAKPGPWYRYGMPWTFFPSFTLTFRLPHPQFIAFGLFELTWRKLVLT